VGTVGNAGYPQNKIMVKKLITWHDFKQLSLQEQEEYLNYLIERYKISATTLSRVFGVTSAAILKHITVNNMNVKFKVGHRMTKGERQEWEIFHNTAEEGVLVDRRVADKETESFTLMFDGTICPKKIANSIKGITGNAATGHVEVVGTIKVK
jgi:hypothetical protein